MPVAVCLFKGVGIVPKVSKRIFTPARKTKALIPEIHRPINVPRDVVIVLHPFHHTRGNQIVIKLIGRERVFRFDTVIPPEIFSVHSTRAIQTPLRPIEEVLRMKFTDIRTPRLYTARRIVPFKQGFGHLRGNCNNVLQRHQAFL